MREKPSEWITIADLMSGVMAVVVLMLIVAVVKSRVEATASELRAAQETKANKELAARDATPRRRPDVSRAMEAIRSKLASLPVGGMKVEVDADNHSFDIEKAITFEIGQWKLTELQKRQLANLARAIREELACQIPSLRARVAGPACQGADSQLNVILIEGHADSTPASGGPRFEDNLELSTKRAAEVFRAMFDLLSDLRNREGQPLLGAAGYGDLRPRTRASGASHTRASEEDRRIEIRLLLDPEPGKR